MPEYEITTYDNPYSPFDEFDKWYQFDENVMHYRTQEYLSRIEDLYEGLDEKTARQAAIDEVVKYNIRGIWCKITREQANKLKLQRNGKL